MDKTHVQDMGYFRVKLSAPNFQRLVVKEIDPLAVEYGPENIPDGIKD